jgi:hypothetical protein
MAWPCLVIRYWHSAHGNANLQRCAISNGGTGPQPKAAGLRMGGCHEPMRLQGEIMCCRRKIESEGQKRLFGSICCTTSEYLQVSASCKGPCTVALSHWHITLVHAMVSHPTPMIPSDRWEHRIYPTQIFSRNPTSRSH